MAEELFKTREYKESIIKKYFQMVYKLALNQTKSTDNADDVVQEVFLRYIQKDIDFESEEHIKSWLLRVTINCSKNVFLNSWFKKTTKLEDNISIEFDSPEKSEVYYKTLELPQKYRMVIHLFYYEDLSIAQISQYLKIKESTVKSQLHRARKMLEPMLKGGYNFV